MGFYYVLLYLGIYINNLVTCISCEKGIMHPGVISKGLRGWSPLVKIVVHFGGLSPPNFCINLAFQNKLALLAIVCMVLLWWISSLLYGYWDLCRCWLYCITIRLNYHVSIFKNMGVAPNRSHPLSNIAPRAPLFRIFRNHPCMYPLFPTFLGACTLWGLRHYSMKCKEHLLSDLFCYFLPSLTKYVLYWILD